VFGAECRSDPAFRTETSLSGDGYIFELCLRTGMFLSDWLTRRVFGIDPTAGRACYERLEAAADAIPPGSEGLLLLPYWGGVMPPHWDLDARGAMVGLCADHGRGHLYRALIEGIALDTASGYAAIEAVTGEPVREIVVIGGGAHSPLWRRIVADATGREVLVSDTVEASSLGAGMLAAVAAGWYASPAEAARAMQGRTHDRLTPDNHRVALYAELREIYDGLYPALRQSFARLARLKERAAA
jgi:xylulokinase